MSGWSDEDLAAVAEYEPAWGFRPPGSLPSNPWAAPPPEAAQRQEPVDSEPPPVVPADLVESPEPAQQRRAEIHAGQVRMAYRLAGPFAERLLYVDRIGWYWYDGRRWAEDRYGMAKRAVLWVLRHSLAGSLGDQELRRDVRRCESDAGINGILGIARSLPEFAATADDLDSDPYLLNVANGTLDLRTMQLRAHDPADRCTKIAGAAYAPANTEGDWARFLGQVLPAPDVRGYVQRLAGVGLLGQVIEHTLTIFTGTGANGKSTLIKAIGAALGDYAITADPDLFTRKPGTHTTGETDLLGARWVVVSETEQDQPLHVAAMKRLVGGDRIKARRMRQDNIEFAPSHTPVMVTNHLPKVRGDDPAIWRRLRVVPFAVVIPPADRNPHLDDVLRDAAAEVLAWAIAGWQDYNDRSGLAEPESVIAATDAYQASSDAVARFVAECCSVSPSAFVPSGELYERWQRWAAYDGAEPLSAKALGQALDRLGYPAAKVNRGLRVRRGLGLLTEDEAADDA